MGGGLVSREGNKVGVGGGIVEREGDWVWEGV